MIEIPILNALLSDSTLVDLLSTFNGAPAIFSENAPETAEKPYAIIRCLRNSKEYSVIQNFTIFVDTYDFDESRVNSREAAERIEFVLDEKIFTSTRYSEIRVDEQGGGPIPEADPRDVHYNSQFQARAIRCKWITQTH